MAGTANKGVAWVTGAGTGIGRALAKRLAEDGWTVAVSARTARDLDSLAAEVPGRITAFQLDVTDAKATEDTGRAIAASLGPIDLAILNAGSYFPDDGEEVLGREFPEDRRHQSDGHRQLHGARSCPRWSSAAAATSPSWAR